MAFIHEQLYLRPTVQRSLHYLSGLHHLSGSTSYSAIFRFLHLLNGVTLSILRFQGFYCHFNLCYLPFNHRHLSFSGKRNFLELTVTDNRSIRIIPCCNPRTKFFPVRRFKVFLRGSWNLFAPGYRRRKSLAHCSVKWFGTTNKLFWHSPSRLLSIAAAIISKVFPAPTQ